MNYVFYIADCETTGLTHRHGIIEISLYRLKDNYQKTWFLTPFENDIIESSALKKNKYLLEDITCKTKFGKETFKDPKKTIIDIENWLLQDNSLSEDRVLIGQNISFDKMMLQTLWHKCESEDSFPFGKRIIDTMQIELVFDIAKNTVSDSYALSSILKKYGIKNEKAHTAEADVKATKELFDKQIDYIKKLIK